MHQGSAFGRQVPFGLPLGGLSPCPLGWPRAQRCAQVPHGASCAYCPSVSCSKGQAGEPSSSGEGQLFCLSLGGRGPLTSGACFSPPLGQGSPHPETPALSALAAYDRSQTADPEATFWFLALEAAGHHQLAPLLWGLCQGPVMTRPRCKTSAPGRKQTGRRLWGYCPLSPRGQPSDLQTSHEGRAQLIKAPPPPTVPPTGQPFDTRPLGTLDPEPWHTQNDGDQVPGRCCPIKRRPEPGGSAGTEAHALHALAPSRARGQSPCHPTARASAG